MNIQKINNVAFNGYLLVTGYKNGNKIPQTRKINTGRINSITHSPDYASSEITYQEGFTNKPCTIVIDNSDTSSCPADRHNAIVDAFTAAHVNDYISIEI